VTALHRSIQEIGIELPVDVGGSSLGGSMALEAAKSRGSRWRDRLPARTRLLEKPERGHVPMSVDPLSVSQVIVEGCENLAGVSCQMDCQRFENRG
jgi:hypothetical protein